MAHPIGSNAGREEFDAQFGKNPQINEARQELITANQMGWLAGSFKEQMSALNEIEQQLARTTLEEERAKLMRKVGKILKGTRLAA